MSTSPLDSTEFCSKLSLLATLGVTVGVNLQRGQELIITAPLEASTLVRHVTKVAYQRGARLVTCLYDDPGMIHDRFAHADDNTLDCAPEWIYRGMAEALENGAARLNIVGPYPDLLSGVPADKIIRVHRALARASRAEARFTSSSQVNWSTLPFATGGWAAQVFPDLPSAEAAQALWKVIFDVTRVSSPDPYQAWQEHNRTLNTRRDYLQTRRLASLHFYDGRTDLTVGLVDGHTWVGGTARAGNGIEGNCNIPTEELFTCPHRERVHGRVHFSKPLALAGTLVENLYVEFRDGLASTIKADRGLETIQALLASDDGARRLGEIGLVPHASVVSRAGILFYNALFDENAASHVAFGQSYAACLGIAREPSQQPEATGANHSAIHIDCMFGTSAMNVDGISETGRVEPLMREGEFLI